MKIVVNEEIKELQAKCFDGVEWIEWTEGLLESEGALNQYSEEKQLYVLSEKEYEWWQKQIKKLNEIDCLENALSESQMDEYIKKEFNGKDLEDNCNLRLKWLRERNNHYAKPFRF